MSVSNQDRTVRPRRGGRTFDRGSRGASVFPASPPSSTSTATLGLTSITIAPIGRLPADGDQQPRREGLDVPIAGLGAGRGWASPFGGTATRSSVFGSLLITCVPGEGSGPRARALIWHAIDFPCERRLDSRRSAHGDGKRNRCAVVGIERADRVGRKRLGKEVPVRGVVWNEAFDVRDCRVPDVRDLRSGTEGKPWLEQRIRLDTGSMRSTQSSRGRSEKASGSNLTRTPMRSSSWAAVNRC